MNNFLISSSRKKGYPPVASLPWRSWPVFYALPAAIRRARPRFRPFEGVRTCAGVVAHSKGRTTDETCRQAIGRGRWGYPTIIAGSTWRGCAG